MNDLQVDLRSEDALRSLLESFSLPPSHYLVVIIKRYIQVTRVFSMMITPLPCQHRHHQAITIWSGYQHRILYHPFTSWPLNNWRRRQGMISTHPPIATKSRFCRSFIRYLGRLDPGYSQHLGLSTIELSKVHSLLPLVLTRFWLTQMT